VKVRRAGRGDAAALAALWSELLRIHAALDPRAALREGAEAGLESEVARALRDADTALWIADAEGGCAAFAAARLARTRALARESCRVEITELYVHPAARRRGLGRALVEAVLGWARERGAARAEVRVVARNESAQAFWRAQGFGDFVDVLDRGL
jgi:GNAT superfamily N-acetyltransferase